MTKTSIVCTSWEKTFIKYIRSCVDKETPNFWQTAISKSLDLCNLAKYPVFEFTSLSPVTCQMHTLYFEEHFLLVVEFSRLQQDDHDRHTLAAQYIVSDTTANRIFAFTAISLHVGHPTGLLGRVRPVRRGQGRRTGQLGAGPHRLAPALAQRAARVLHRYNRHVACLFNKRI